MQPITGLGSNLTKGVKIEQDRITINASENPVLNKSAKLYFYGTYVNPRVLRDGDDCSSNVCSAVTVGNGYASLNVTGFSTYEMTGRVWCGDGQCNGGESCSSCSADCGSCPPPPGNGGGDNDGDGNVCTPEWSCNWGACINGVERKTCVKTNNCALNTSKPTDEVRTCNVTSVRECIDNDGDGYGVGRDCIGEDLNDNDISITDVLNPNLDGKEKSSWISYGVIILLVVGIIVLTLVILYKKSKVRSTQAKFNVNQFGRDKIMNK